MIDPRAIVASNAKIGQNVKIDAFVIIEDDVEIGPGSWIGSHSIIRSHTEIGSGNRIHEFAVIGGEPQSFHYAGESTTLKIGNNNIIREFVTISRGTSAGREVTRIGDDNMLMAYSHIAHDCELGNNCIFANGSSLAGHVTIGNYAFLGGFTMVHQNCRIGSYCMTGINTVLRQDVAPYLMVTGNPAQVVSINSRGLKRNGFSLQSISALKKVFKLYFRDKVGVETLRNELDEQMREDDHVIDLIEFLGCTERGVVRNIYKQ